MKLPKIVVLLQFSWSRSVWWPYTQSVDATVVLAWYVLRMIRLWRNM